MQDFSIAQAKAKLSAVIDAVQAGEEVIITRRGVAVARVVPMEKTVADLSVFDAHRGSLPKKFKFDRDLLNARIR